MAFEISSEQEMIRLMARDFAKEAHEGQFRESGEPYFVHPEHVAKILIGLGLDDETVAAGYLHDVVEDCGYTYNGCDKTG